jgi:hypothetical protein
MTDLSQSVNLCPRCESRPAAAPHECPYDVEINENHESLCDCCEACEQDCCDDSYSRRSPRRST